MSLTNFPNGISSFGVPQIGNSGGSPGEIPVTLLGKYYFVDSNNGSSGNSGLEPTKALDKITNALAKCTNDKNDVIIVLSGHTESLSGASALNVNKSGVTIVGLGKGEKRPNLELQTAATTIAMAAANTTLDNLIISAGAADIVAGIITSADDVTIKNIYFKDSATSENYLTCIATDSTDNSSDNLHIFNCERLSPDAGCLAFFSMLGNTKGLWIQGCFDSTANADDVGHFIIMAAKVALNARIIGNIENLTGDNNAQTVGVFATGSSTTSTGVMAYNLCGSLDTTTELFDTATLDFQHFENYMTGTIAKSGRIMPAMEAA